MRYYDVPNVVAVSKMNMRDERPCGYGTLTPTAVRIRHLVKSLPQRCTKVSGALKVSLRPAQRSQYLQNLTIL